MNNHKKTSIVYLTIILIYIHIAKTEDYDDKSVANYEENSYEDSESNEMYNSSSIPNTHPNSTLLRDNGKCKRTGLSDYPYSVSIQKKSSHYASGALVHRKWILTVASEFFNIRETIKLFRARLGSVNCKKGGDLVPLKGIEIHPSYVYKQPGFDVALLRIGPRVHCSDNIRPITLSIVTGLTDNAKFLVTYWPRLIVSGKILSQSAKERMKQYSMRVSTQKMIPWKKCYNVMQTYNQTLDVSSLCLEPIISHHSPCMSDVGAPIIAKDGLWGITSGWVSYDCSIYPSPTIVTRISLEPMTSWLYTLLDDEKK